MGEFDDKIEELESEIKRLQEEKLSLQMLDMERQNARLRSAWNNSRSRNMGKIEVKRNG